MTTADRLLEILKSQPGRPFSYAQLTARLWPEAQDYPPAHFVHHLHELAYRLRIDDVSDGTIATISRYGYVWAEHRREATRSG